jgi:TolA-binding protein
MGLTLIILTLLSLQSCLKTTEQLKREQMLDDVQTQVGQSQQSNAELSLQIRDLQEKLAATTGKIEELNYANSENTKFTELENSQNLINQQMKVLTTENEILKKEVQALKKIQAEQADYIKKVLAALNVASGGSTTKPTAATTSTLFTEANQLFEKSAFKEAKAKYLQTLDENKINAAQKNQVYYNLGFIDYQNKKYNEAIVYFSKIYANYPRSSYAPKALLYIARCFAKLDQKAEAKQSYQELIKNYPDSPQVKYAKQEMN